MNLNATWNVQRIQSDNLVHLFNEMYDVGNSFRKRKHVCTTFCHVHSKHFNSCFASDPNTFRDVSFESKFYFCNFNDDNQTVVRSVPFHVHVFNVWKQDRRGTHCEKDRLTKPPEKILTRQTSLESISFQRFQS